MAEKIHLRHPIERLVAATKSQTQRQTYDPDIHLRPLFHFVRNS